MKLLKIEDLLVPVTNIKLATMGSNIILFRHGDGDHNTLRRNPNLTPLKKHVCEAAAILDFEKTAIVGAWHHPDLISRGSEDSKTVLTSNTCFFKGVKVKIATIPPDY